MTSSRQWPSRSEARRVYPDQGPDFMRPSALVRPPRSATSSPGPSQQVEAVVKRLTLAVGERRIEPLSVDECLELVLRAQVGRVAYLHEGAPAIIPVNYVLHDAMVVFRLSYGTTLDAIASGARVAFEVDRIDEAQEAGWSVVIHGKAEEIWLPRELEVARQFRLNPWAPGDRDHYVRICPSAITGRRIT